MSTTSSKFKRLKVPYLPFTLGEQETELLSKGCHVVSLSLTIAKHDILLLPSFLKPNLPFSFPYQVQSQ